MPTFVLGVHFESRSTAYLCSLSSCDGGMVSFFVDTQFHELIKAGELRLRKHSGEAYRCPSSVEET